MNRTDEPSDDEPGSGDAGSRFDGSALFDRDTDGTDREYRADGGQSAGGGQMFSDSEFTDVTMGQRLSEVFYQSIYEPFVVAWEDWRTKVGLSIISLYLLLGAVAWVSTSEFLILDRITIIEPARGDGPIRLAPFQDWSYPLGTDMIGRDLLAAMIHATPRMLQMILAGAVFATVVATVVGTLAGYKGGITERALMTIADVLMTIPGLPLVIVLIVLIDPSSPYLIGIIIVVNAWAGLARTIHSQVLTIREHSYVEASRTMGIGTPTIIRKDLLPNLMPYILINFTSMARRVIYDSVALYFLGVISVNTIENWGVMMNIGYENNALIIPEVSHLLFVPMVFVVGLSFGLILFSQGTDRLFNPRVRARGSGSTKSKDDEEITTGGGAL
ncbi:ABC transporter permease [Natrarchaeobius chitinivorans]|nr:ABC transporter permease [Natrarchaeobius chitinivorans]